MSAISDLDLDFFCRQMVLSKSFVGNEDKKVDVLFFALNSCNDDEKFHLISLLYKETNTRFFQRKKLKDLFLRWFKFLPRKELELMFDHVSDIPETIALLNDQSYGFDDVSGNRYTPCLSEISKQIFKLKNTKKEEQDALILKVWKSWDESSLFLFNQLIIGGFKLERSVFVKALAKLKKTEIKLMELSLKKKWGFQQGEFNDVFERDIKEKEKSLIYFSDFQNQQFIDFSTYIENANNQKSLSGKLYWKGKRVQWIIDGEEDFIWGENDARYNDRFPEMKRPKVDSFNNSPLVLCGTFIAMKDGVVLSEVHLEKRLKTNKPSKKMIEDIPIVFILNEVKIFNFYNEGNESNESNEGNESNERSGGYTLIDSDPIIEEITRLSNGVVLNNQSLHTITEDSLRLVEAAGAYGILLDRTNKNGYQIILEPSPEKMDVALLYVKRADPQNPNGTFTFGIQQNGEWVPVSSSSEGIETKDLKTIKEYIKAHTLDKFGPVRQVEPWPVFRLFYKEKIENKRKKCGFELRGTWVEMI